MTSLNMDDFEVSENHPLDILELIVSQNEWPYDRTGNEEMTAVVNGEWSDFHVRYFWMQEENILQAACMLDMRIPNDKKNAIYETINLINERLVIGNFAIWTDDNTVMLRCSQILSQEPFERASACEKLTELLLEECNRYYPVFQFVLWAGKDPQEALEAAMLETVGQA